MTAQRVKGVEFEITINDTKIDVRPDLFEAVERSRPKHDLKFDDPDAQKAYDYLTRDDADSLTIDDVRKAVMKLRNDNAPPMSDGSYSVQVSASALKFLSEDPVFKSMRRPRRR